MKLSGKVYSFLGAFRFRQGWFVAFVILLTFLCATSLLARDELVLSGQQDTSNRSLWRAVVLGFVEGATEYLPVSSTGHLLLVQEAMGASSNEASKTADDALAICIQIGAILAVAVLYRNRLLQMLRGISGSDTDGRRLVFHLGIAFLPSAIIGLLLHGWIKEHLFGVRPVIVALFVGGVLILSTAKTLAKRGQNEGRTLQEMTWKTSLMIGIAQCCAFFPGFSRSLATILGGFGAGLSLSAAVEFSFLLGLLTLSAATAFESAQSGLTIIEYYGLLFPIVALLVAFVSAMLSIKFMIRLLTSYGLKPFGYYRIILACLCAVLL